jgi:hypothetical protein
MGAVAPETSEHTNSNVINRGAHEFCSKSRMKVALQFLQSYFNTISLTIQFE